MRDLAPTLIAWNAAGHRFALATVVGASGSSPRPVNSSMTVRDDGLIAGSVSGGCVEGAVVAAAQRALTSGKPELLEFGPTSDAVLFEVGLSCGGQIRVWVEAIEPSEPWGAFVDALANGEYAARALRLSSEDPAISYRVGSRVFGDPDLAEVSQNVDVEKGPVFVAAYPARERLVIVGAVHIAVHLVRLAKGLGFETVVIDPRQAFAQPERFPDPPVRLIAQWSEKALAELGIDANTFLVTLSHDSKIDDPALFAAVRGGAAFVGALGSRRTQVEKRCNLMRMGLSEEEVAQITGPVGIDIGSVTPEEIALSIMAQIVQAKRGSKAAG